MMKRKNRIILGICLGILLPIHLQAESQGWQLGIRGGISKGTGTGMDSVAISPQGGIDARYTIYWKPGKNGQIGFITGLDLSYGNTTMKGNVHDTIMNVSWRDAYGLTQRVDYYTHIVGTEHHQYVLAQVPLFFSVRSGGFTMALGPKFRFTVIDYCERDLTSNEVIAKFKYLGPQIKDDPYAGVLPSKGKSWYSLPFAGLTLAAEIGGEIPVGPSHRLEHNEKCIGIQAYIEWGCIHLAKGASVTITPSELDFNPNAKVQYHGITNQSATAWQNLNAGIRLYYTFQPIDYTARRLYHHKR